MQTPPSSLLVPLLLPLLLFGCAASEAYQYEDAPYADVERGAPGGYGLADAPQQDSGRDFFDELLGGGAPPPSRKLAQAPAPPPAPSSGAPPPEEAPSGSSPAVTDDRAPQKRLMIYRADYTVRVANVDEAVKKLLAKAEEKRGYLQARSDGTVTVRVPAEVFFELTAELASFGTITAESLQAQDVTKQFMDLTLRVETATRSRARLLELLQQATKMEDILRIEAEVRRLTEEIESMKGELRYLSDQIAFSTLTVRFLSNAPPPSPAVARKRSPFEWVNHVGIERVLYDF